MGLLGHVVHVDPITADPGFGTQLMMDGGPHVADWLSPLNPAQCLPPNVNSPSCQYLLTSNYLLYDRVNRTAYLPDGTVERFDGNNDLISSTDPFGNAISLVRDSANKKV